MTEIIDPQILNNLRDALIQLKSSDAQDSETFAKVFKGNKLSYLTPLMTMALSSLEFAPIFDSSVDYSKKSKEIWSQLNSNLESLKEKCAEKNLLESMSQSVNTTELQGCENNDPNNCENSDTLIKIRRKRRSDEELNRDECCPFVGCDKVYSSKSSLKLHMKRNHTNLDLIKEDFDKPLPIISQFKKGVDINRVFKPEYIPEIA